MNSLVVIEKTVKNLLRARQINQAIRLPSKIWQDIKIFLKNNPSINRIIIPVIDNKFSITEIICNPNRLLIVSSWGIIDEKNKATLMPSYGVWKLAYYLSRHLTNIDVQVIDPNLISYSAIKRKLQQEKFNFVGFSIIPANLKNDLKLISLFKNIQPEITVIIGGIESHVLQNTGILNALESILVIGAGETALVNIIKARLQNKKDSKSVARVIIGERVEKYNFDKNILPVDKVDLIHERFYQNISVHVTVTNQCRFSCFWCSSPKNGPFFKSPEEVIAHIEAQQLDKVSQIVFQDNDISYNADFMIELCDLLKQRGYLGQKHCKASIAGMSDRLLKALSLANFVRIAYGIESFDEEVRRILGKNIRSDYINSILNSTLKYNIIPEINLIVFSPAENLQSLRRTLSQAAIWLKRGTLLFVVFRLYAVLGHESDHFGIIYDNIYHDGMKNDINLPHTYVISKDIALVWQKVQENYMKELDARTQTPNHIKSLIKLKIISEFLGLTKQATTFNHYISKFTDSGSEYVAV